MHYALIRPRKASAPDSHARPAPRSRQPMPAQVSQTLGDRLRAKAGPAFGPAWLAHELGCSTETAAELAGYWIPQGPPHLLEQTLNVFANALDLDGQRLQALVHSAPALRSEAPPRAAAPRRPRPASAPTASAPASAPPPTRQLTARPQAEISIGSAEGVRVVKQSQPTIVYRKTRKYAATT